MNLPKTLVGIILIIIGTIFILIQNIVSLIYGPILIIIGIAFLLFSKEENKIEQRKDIKTKKH